MKIAIVCYPTFGGSGVVATELGIALAERGHEVHFVTYQQPVRLGLLNNNIYFHEVHVPEYPLFRYQPYELALSSKLVDTIKRACQLSDAGISQLSKYSCLVATRLLKTIVFLETARSFAIFLKSFNGL